MKRIFLTLILSLCLLITPLWAGQRYIKFDAQTGGWTATNTVTGATSGATAVIKEIQDDGTTGVLELVQVVGTFQDNEIIYESALGEELVANGGFAANTIGWTPGNCTLSSAAGGQIGNCLKALLPNASVGWGGQEVTVETSKFYRIAFFHHGQAGTGDECNGGIDIDSAAFASTGNLINSGSLIDADWVERNYILEAISTSFFLTFWTNCGTQFDYTLWDEISVKVITNAALINGSPFGGARAIW